jgi:hypothetical protein
MRVMVSLTSTVRTVLSHEILGSPISGWLILLVLIAFFAWLWIGLGIAPWSWRHFYSP